MRPLAGIEWTWLGSFLRPQRAAIAALLGLSLGVSALALVQPFITKLLIDDGLIARDFPKLLQFAILIFVIGLAASLLGGINRLDTMERAMALAFWMSDAAPVEMSSSMSFSAVRPPRAATMRSNISLLELNGLSSVGR